MKVIVYYPKAEEKKLDLSKRVAEAHADFVYRKINALNCPDEQKLQLLDTIIATVKQRAKQEEEAFSQFLPLNNTIER